MPLHQTRTARQDERINKAKNEWCVSWLNTLSLCFPSEHNPERIFGIFDTLAQKDRTRDCFSHLTGTSPKNTRH
jgi:hypothetical protein